jgi:hypothetical protein
VVVAPVHDRSIIAIVGVMLVVRGTRPTATTARPNEGGL